MTVSIPDIMYLISNASKIFYFYPVLVFAIGPTNFAGAQIWGMASCWRNHCVFSVSNFGSSKKMLMVSIMISSR